MKKLFLVPCFLVLLFVGYEYFTLPDVSSLKKENPKETALMRQREKEMRSLGKKIRHQQVWVPLSAIPDYLKIAVLIGEDDAFYQHEGYDLNQIKESFIRNWEKKGLVRGGSTITQQLAKNLYLSTSKSPLRKIKEFLIARRLEEELTKRRILEIYLNVIEWGDGIYGVESATQVYFGKSAHDLKLQDAVLLAAVIPNPHRMNPTRPSRRVQNRYRIILDRMAQYGHVSEQEYEQAKKISTIE
jgi:monofunctional glycosyltransferase